MIRIDVLPFDWAVIAATQSGRYTVKDQTTGRRGSDLAKHVNGLLIATKAVPRFIKLANERIECHDLTGDTVVTVIGAGRREPVVVCKLAVECRNHSRCFRE